MNSKKEKRLYTFMMVLYTTVFCLVFGMVIMPTTLAEGMDIVTPTTPSEPNVVLEAIQTNEQVYLSYIGTNDTVETEVEEQPELTTRQSATQAIKLTEMKGDLENYVVVTSNDVAGIDFPTTDGTSITIETYEKGTKLKAVEYFKEGYILTNKNTYIKTDDVKTYREELNTLGGKITEKSGLSASEINHYLEQYEELAGLGDAVIRTEKKYGINAFMITSVMILESGRGESRIAQNKNNLFGLGAFDGDAYRKAFIFDTKADSIDYFGKLMTKYIAKGRDTLWEVNDRYCTSGAWGNKVKKITSKLYSSAENLREEQDRKIDN